MAETRYRHWKNTASPGQVAFATTTVLDFVHAFRREEPRTAMAEAMLLECRALRSVVHAYVVMPHHIHLLAFLPEGSNIQRLMQRIKLRGSQAVRPLLTSAEIVEFGQQRGLNGNVFWQRSFRSVPVVSEAAFIRKVGYIHQNPVRGRLASAPEDYRWSSALLWTKGRWGSETGLDYGELLDSLRTWPCAGG